jgi:predicted nuclease of predicted toxin-antitoxin system
MPIFVDHHVHSGITKGLRRRGIDVLTAEEDGRASAPDDQLLERATALGRPIFTQDDDFLEIADRWRQTGRHFAGVVYAHQLRATVGQIVTDLQLICEACVAEDLNETVIFLPL